MKFEILPLRPFTREEVLPIVTGYETREIYTVEKTETDAHTLFDIRLVSLEKPYRAAFVQDFTVEEYEIYLRMLPQGYCFGTYQAGRLIGFVIGEAFQDDDLLRVWEFHVMDGFRRMGVGRALMEQEVSKARQDHLTTVMVETQNTNVKAIRFYRSMGFTLESIDLSPMHYGSPREGEPNQVAFYMKRRLKDT